MFDIKKGAQDKPAESPREAQRPEMSSRPEPSRATGSRDQAVIGPSIHIDGDVRGEEDLLIEGEVGGTVQLKNNSLTIGPNGKVRADVYAHSIYVDGYVEGDLFGAERVHIRKSAQVKGNVTSPRVSVEDGAKFKGAIEMDPQAAQGGNRPSAPRNAAPQQAPAKPVMQSQPPKPEQPVVAKTGAAS
jgi:cytoskeletal protein CcmA (bactofilin family)